MDHHGDEIAHQHQGSGSQLGEGPERQFGEIGAGEKAWRMKFY